LASSRPVLATASQKAGHRDKIRKGIISLSAEDLLAPIERERNFAAGSNLGSIGGACSKRHGTRPRTGLQRPNPALFKRPAHDCDCGLERLWRGLGRFGNQCSSRTLHHGTSSRNPYLGCRNRCDRLSHLSRYRGRNKSPTPGRSAGLHHYRYRDRIGQRNDVLFHGDGLRCIGGLRYTGEWYLDRSLQDYSLTDLARVQKYERGVLCSAVRYEGGLV
jgi:hypothetical protein